MQRTVGQRLLWAGSGFFLGIAATIAYTAMDLWPFQDDVFLHWVRWLGKETIKWSYNAVVFVIVAFVVMQILNLIFLLFFGRQEHPSDSATAQREFGLREARSAEEPRG